VGFVFRKICDIVQQPPARFDWSNSLPRASALSHSIIVNIYTGIIISRFDAFGMKCESGDLSCQPIPEPPTRGLVAFAVSDHIMAFGAFFPPHDGPVPNENNNFVRYVGPVAPPLFMA